MLKVGDVVRINPSLEYDDYNGVGTVSKMVNMRGQTVTISHVNKSYADYAIYHIKEDGGEWNWTEPMFLCDKYGRAILYTTVEKDDISFDEMMEMLI